MARQRKTSDSFAKLALLGSGGLLALCLAAAPSKSVQTPLTASEPVPAPVHYDQSYLKGPPPATPVPAWAFTMDPPASADLKRQADDDVPRHVPNSDLAITRRHVLDHNDAADWHPDNHPPAPSIVMYGRKPQPAACAFCHLPNGQGAPENAPLVMGI